MEVKDLIINYEEAIKIKQDLIKKLARKFDIESVVFIGRMQIDIDLLEMVIQDLKNIK
jgi:cell division FtsZ-interacting protein ZapD